MHRRQFREACVRCPLLRVDPTRLPRLEEIQVNLVDRLQEAKEQGWLGEVAAIETTIAAVQELEAMRAMTTHKMSVHLGIPNFHSALGRSNLRNWPVRRRCSGMRSEERREVMGGGAELFTCVHREGRSDAPAVGIGRLG